MGQNPDFAKSGRSYPSGAAAQKIVLLPKKCVAHNITVTSASAEFILIFDATVVPANADTSCVDMVKLAAGATFQFTYPKGKIFESGICVATSSTGPALTAGSSNGWACATVDV